LTQCTN